MIGEQHFEEDIQKEFLKRIPEEERCIFHRMIEKAFENPVTWCGWNDSSLREGTKDVCICQSILSERTRRIPAVLLLFDGYKQSNLTIQDKK